MTDFCVDSATEYLIWFPHLNEHRILNIKPAGVDYLDNLLAQKPFLVPHCLPAYGTPDIEQAQQGKCVCRNTSNGIAFHLPYLPYSGRGTHTGRTRIDANVGTTTPWPYGTATVQALLKPADSF